MESDDVENKIKELELEWTKLFKDPKEIFINLEENDDEIKTQQSQKIEEKYKGLEGSELLTEALENYINPDFLNEKLGNFDCTEFFVDKLLQILQKGCESEVDEQDCHSIKETCGVNIKERWKSQMCQDNASINSYESADFYRLLFEEINLISHTERSYKTSYKLQKHILHNYGELVDEISEKGINNYSKEIKKMWVNVPIEPQCRIWESSVCKIDCDKINVSHNELNFLQPLLKEQCASNCNISKEMVVDTIVKRIKTILENCPPKIFENSKCQKLYPIFKTENLNCSSDNTSFETETNVSSPSCSGKRKITNQFDSSFKKTENLRNMKKINAKSANMNTAKYKKVEEKSVSNNSNLYSKKEDSESFKTAKSVLLDQKDKTNGRKCLGTRRGPSSKFVSPIYKHEEEEVEDKEKDTQNELNKEIEDERLKGIDPKMVEIMMSEIMDHSNPTSWEDIAGLEFVKDILKEIVVWPMLRPDIFTGLRGPPKGILLFGPPGTGKTLIGKCVASQSKSTFFSVSASSLGSKWYGEGEKLVRALFTVARCYQPSVIFIDEIDSLLTQRSDNDHETSRRVKTEFLVQLDGVKTLGDERLLIIGATNRPQELDEAARRRLVKRLYIPLPEPNARIQIVKTLLTNQSHQLNDQDYEFLKEKTDGYSGADMTNLCKEAALGPIRSIGINDITSITSDEVRPIQAIDFMKALKQVRASVSDTDLNLYEEWNKKYGSIF